MADDERERRPRRGGLAGVLLLAALIVGGWSAWWWFAKSRVEAALAAYQPADAQGAVGWRAASVGGWPFRLRVTLSDARATLPDRVGVSAPRVIAQAYAYAPTRWVATAPNGLTILRPVAGAVDVRGRVLRASAVNLAGAQPRFAFEGRDLILTPRAGADPFLLDTIGALNAEFVRGPPGVDEAALLITLERGHARPAGLLSYIGQGGETSLRWDAVITRYGRLDGDSMAEALRRWSQDGGTLRLREVRLQAGPNSATTRDGTLSLAEDGRLAGRIDVLLRGGPLALSALGGAEPVDDAGAARAGEMARDRQDAQQQSRLMVAFQNGVATVGGIPIGPAPDLF